MSELRVLVRYRETRWAADLINTMGSSPGTCDYEPMVGKHDQPRATGHHWVLLRRNDTPNEIAYNRAFSPCPVPLGVLVKGAGQRWRVEECFQPGKGLTGSWHHPSGGRSGLPGGVLLRLLAVLSATRVSLVALVGVPVGSRVLLSLPPADGYGAAGKDSAGIAGTDTLVFVVDIVGAVAFPPRPVRPTKFRNRPRTWPAGVRRARDRADGVDYGRPGRADHTIGHRADQGNRLR